MRTRLVSNLSFVSSLWRCSVAVLYCWAPRVLWWSLVFVFIFACESQAQTLPTVTLPEVTVRGSTPLMSVPLPEKNIPVNVQVTNGDDYTESGALNLTDFLARDLAGVSLTHVQNNPFQPDVTYRGFTSSFLLGTPPGLSVFVDGARVNEPLADQVNWDLIPQDAIERIELIPGSNPVYGRNTLGGAIVMETKRGLTNPGSVAEVWGGSFGRVRTLLQTGGKQGPIDYFISGNWFTEDGFRDFSTSNVGQVFGKVGYFAGLHDLTFSLTYINNRLTGNGPLPESCLARDRSAVFTHPDRFSPEFLSLNSQYHLDLGSGFSLAATTYGRLLDIHQFNRDVEEDVLAQTAQDGWGSSVQLTYQNSMLGVPLTAIAGLDYTGATLRHRIAEREFGEGDDNEDGNGDDVEERLHASAEAEEEAFAATTDVTSETHGGGAFFTITAEPTEQLAITAAGRFDTTALKINDRLATKGDEERTTDASGSHRFERFRSCLGKEVLVESRWKSLSRSGHA